MLGSGAPVRHVWGAASKETNPPTQITTFVGLRVNPSGFCSLSPRFADPCRPSARARPQAGAAAGSKAVLAGGSFACRKHAVSKETSSKQAFWRQKCLEACLEAFLRQKLLTTGRRFLRRKHAASKETSRKLFCGPQKPLCQGQLVAAGRAQPLHLALRGPIRYCAA